ncbi:hypothetical protein ACFC0D_37795 [Streptomyces sp. NPDC056222]|uniref:hypothetical protein n=1 Tax=Streptomyces sp. NPDC056222 TaxID=3345749 RepID=UPI0035E17422
MIVPTGVTELMRLTPLVTTATAALLALTTLTGRGGGNSDGTGQGTSVDEVLGSNPERNGGTNGSGPGIDLELPTAGSMRRPAEIINAYTECDDLSTDPDDDDFFPGDEAYDEKWTVTERGACGRGIRIFMFTDMRTFQAAYKTDLDEDRKESPNKGHRGKFLIGKDFAVLNDRSAPIRSLLQPGALMMLNCHPDFTTPSGYRKDDTLVEGCVLTNYYED